MKFFLVHLNIHLSKDIESAALLRRGRMLQVQIHPTFFVTPTVYKAVCTVQGKPVVFYSETSQSIYRMSKDKQGLVSKWLSVKNS